MNNGENFKKIIELFYKSIFNLDTKTLTQIYTDIYKELLSRKDFASIEDIKVVYEISKQKLIESGVYNV